MSKSKHWAFIRGSIFAKNRLKKATVGVQRGGWVFIRAWALIRIFTVYINPKCTDYKCFTAKVLTLTRSFQKTHTSATS